tara:strand:- start:7378 stop:7659 length:282 start_codon:yes stop_codon:yes gene_type:complete
MTMRRLFQIALLGGIAGFILMGCEKHEFEVTKVLHEAHGGDHGDDHGGDHNAEHEGAKGHEDHTKDDHADGEGKQGDHEAEKGTAGKGRDIGL